MLFLVSNLIVLYNNYYCRHVCIFFVWLLHYIKYIIICNPEYKILLNYWNEVALTGSLEGDPLQVRKQSGVSGVDLLLQLQHTRRLQTIDIIRTVS